MAAFPVPFAGLFVSVRVSVGGLGRTDAFFFPVAHGSIPESGRYFFVGVLVLNVWASFVGVIACLLILGAPLVGLLYAVLLFFLGSDVGFATILVFFGVSGALLGGVLFADSVVGSGAGVAEARHSAIFFLVSLVLVFTELTASLIPSDFQ